MRDLWEILDIQPTDNKRLVKKAYAKKLAQYHPEQYPEEFKEIQQAYDIIMESLQRKYHDEGPIFKEEIRSRSSNQKVHTDSLYDARELTSNPTQQDIEQDTAKQNLQQKDVLELQKRRLYQYMLLKQHISSDTSDKKHLDELESQSLTALLETLQHVKKLEDVHTLFTNEVFYHKLGEEDVYEQVSHIVCNRLSQWDAIVISYLYDTFCIIRNQYQYPRFQWDVPHQILAYNIKKEEKLLRQRKQRMAVFIILFIIGCIAGISGAKMNKDKQIRQVNDQAWLHKQQENKIKENIKHVQQNQRKIEALMNEAYHISYSCTIPSMTMEPMSDISFFCTSSDSLGLIQGKASLDQNANVTRVYDIE